MNATQTIQRRIAAQLDEHSVDRRGYVAPMLIKTTERKSERELLISGWASTGEMDRMDDVIEPRAFASSLRDYMERNAVVLYQHDHDRPIGKTVEAEIRDGGLWVTDVIYSATDVQREVSTLIEQGVLRSLSIGGIVRASEWRSEKSADGEREYRAITDCELVEHSVVSVPANRGAQFGVAAVRSMGSALRKAGVADALVASLVERVTAARGALDEVLATLTAGATSSGGEMAHAEAMFTDADAEKILAAIGILKRDCGAL